ncbi:Putative uncharacterized protein [Lacticaseibacillus paracasei]|nr:Putative uncharacterized protein [Lacticaseibacillus paracasei]
MFLTKED